MKRILAIAAISLMSALTFNSCVDLDLNPLSEGSSSTWYSTKEEVVMSLNDFYRTDFFPLDDIVMGDDLVHRNSTCSWCNGSLTAENGTIATRWQNYYKGIARGLRLINNLETKKISGISDAEKKQYEGEAYLYIGFAYGMIAFHWGQGILDKTGMTLEEAYNAQLSSKADLLAFSYECLDKAAEMLPESYGGIQRFTKGLAYAFKSRIALYHGDYAECVKASQKCMDLGVYKLHDNYEKLFTSSYSEENIFFFRGDVGLKKYYWLAGDSNNPNDVILRNHGGWGTRGISYELLCAYTCIDGKPIDESPLYNPRNLFENRDPRLAMTTVPFATQEVIDKGNYNPADYAFLGIEYSPSPLKYEVMDFNTGNMRRNNDSKANAEHACYNGLPIKKFVDATWLENGRGGAPTTYPFIRYGEVLLNYAEAAIESGKVSQEVLDKTINAVRDRAYKGTGIPAPHVSASQSQAELRTAVRTERYVELALEGHRYCDVIRWKLAGKIYNTPVYYLNRAWAGANWSGDESVVNDAYKRIIKNWREGSFPIHGVPEIDENGFADLSSQVTDGYIVVAATRKFDESRDYLWPIPAGDRLVNPKLGQNPNW